MFAYGFPIIFSTAHSKKTGGKSNKFPLPLKLHDLTAQDTLCTFHLLFGPNLYRQNAKTSRFKTPAKMWLTFLGQSAGFADSVFPAIAPNTLSVSPLGSHDHRTVRWNQQRL